jgi:hypothetical protein
MQGVSRENKLRLLMIYAAINPEKFESDKGTKLMQVIFVLYIEANLLMFCA